MATLRHANSFRDLLVYQKARELQRDVFRLTTSFPKDELFSLTSQIRRSSRSVGANIAEAWAKRRYEAHFISKLTDADSEQMEAQHWIETAVDCSYWSQETATALTKKCEEVGRLLNGMMEKAHLFCGKPGRALHEPSPEYFVGHHPLVDD
jgi:four helix bundle protein